MKIFSSNFNISKGRISQSIITLDGALKTKGKWVSKICKLHISVELQNCRMGYIKEKSNLDIFQLTFQIAPNVHSHCVRHSAT